MGRSILPPGLMFAAGAFLSATGGRAELLINEIHPDPAGSDGGREFVEILNTGPEPVSLLGVAIEFANGATGGPWESRWAGGPGLDLGGGQRWLVTDRNWTGEAAPDTQVWLGLQNGPDAVRLSLDGIVLDLVGYGPLTDPALMEGTPARLETGRALARRPDGRDTGDNGQDFVPAEPTPGKANFLPYALTVAGWTLEPPSLDRTGLTLTAALTLRNVGTETWPAGAAVLEVGRARAEGYLAATAPDDERLLTFGLEPVDEGTLDLVLVLPAPPEPSGSVITAARVQVGPGPLVLNEVVGRPGAGQGEWVEILNPGPGAIELGNFRLGDADGDPRTLPSEYLAAGEIAVLAEDSLALADWRAENASAGVPSSCDRPGATRSLSGWPTLNNTAPEDRAFADRVILVDATGLVVDHLTLGGDGPMAVEEPDGRSLERQAVRPVNPAFSNWIPSGAVAGATPGCPNSIGIGEGPASDLSVAPQVLDPLRDPVVRIRFVARTDGGGWRVRIYDLGGTLIRDFGGEAQGEGPRELVWDGRNDAGLPAGAGTYVVVLRTGADRRRTLLVVR